jgi:alpha-N-arabinofuranosidase
MPRMNRFKSIFLPAIFLPAALSAQSILPLYTDKLVNGFQDWGWGTRNFANTLPTHSGTNSISVAPTSFPGISFHQNDFDTSPYSALDFWANGGTNGGQHLRVNVTLGTSDQNAYTSLPTLTAGSWTHIVIPLSSLNAANKTNLSRITIQPNGGLTGVFYLDDIQLTAAPLPAIVHVSVDANNALRSADARWFGVNTATWDGFLGSAQTTTINLLKEMGCLALRWPGGSTADGYHWASDSTGNTRFRNIATNIGAQAFITVNYGSGSSNEAAAWVKSFNITNNCKFKYWEIGNECYGTWETDTNVPAHDPYTYAVRAAGYISMMKAADPTIKVGVVGSPGEDSYVNNTNHPALNPRTSQTHNGWTPVLLATLKNLGVTPDFLVHHVYPEWTDPGVTPPPVADSDPLLLQAASNWSRDAADLRQQITDYFGTGGTNIELVCTENNSDSSAAFGRQLTSLVNGLYLADSVCRLMKTEFNAYIWWDLRNGHNSSGTFDSTIYGWRTYGDEGMVDGASGKYPTFYAEKLLQYFVRPGDTVLTASSDYLLLAAYAARKADGALTLLMINKDAITNMTAQITLTNFFASQTATVRTYGIPQDEAVRTNGSAALQDIELATNYPVSMSFTNIFPPYSITLFTFAPAAPVLANSSLTQVPGSSSNQFTFDIQGQAGISYVIQNSGDLVNWISRTTNTLSANSLSITNLVPSDAAMNFWRAVWLP